MKRSNSQDREDSSKVSRRDIITATSDASNTFEFDQESPGETSPVNDSFEFDQESSYYSFQHSNESSYYSFDHSNKMNELFPHPYCGHERQYATVYLARSNLCYVCIRNLQHFKGKLDSMSMCTNNPRCPNDCQTENKYLDILARILCRKCMELFEPNPIMTSNISYIERYIKNGFCISKILFDRRFRQVISDYTTFAILLENTRDKWQYHHFDPIYTVNLLLFENMRVQTIMAEMKEGAKYLIFRGCYTHFLRRPIQLHTGILKKCITTDPRLIGSLPEFERFMAIMDRDIVNIIRNAPFDPQIWNVISLMPLKYDLSLHYCLMYRMREDLNTHRFREMLGFSNYMSPPSPPMSVQEKIEEHHEVLFKLQISMCHFLDESVAFESFRIYPYIYKFVRFQFFDLHNYVYRDLFMESLRTFPLLRDQCTKNVLVEYPEIEKRAHHTYTGLFLDILPITRRTGNTNIFINFE